MYQLLAIFVLVGLILIWVGSYFLSEISEDSWIYAPLSITLGALGVMDVISIIVVGCAILVGLIK